MIRAPRARAMSGVASRLKESSTTTSSLQATESRQPPRFTSSSSVRMRTEIDMTSASVRISAPHPRTLADYARRMACHDTEGLHIFDHHRARAHHGSRTYGHAWPDESLGADPGVIANGDGRLEQRNRRIGEVVSARADMTAVGNGCTPPDPDLTQAVDKHVRADRRPVTHLEIPGHQNLRGGGDPRLITDFRAEEAQHRAAPAVARMRTEAHEPAAELPGDPQGLLALRVLASGPIGRYVELDRL